MSESPAQRLQAVKQMLDGGLISQEDYEIMKQQILNEMGFATDQMTDVTSPKITNPNIEFSTFGSYKIISKVGEGGQGSVYKCRHQIETKAVSQGGYVALKLIHASADESTIDRLRREASTGMELDHPNIVKVYDFVTENEKIGIIMDYIDGEDLETKMEKRPTVFTWEEIKDWIGCICDAMSYAHSKGIVHRDIKPENIMFNNDGKLTILDFGIAKRQNDAKKTQIGVGMGTVTYMAPEQYTNATGVDGRADIYALAVMIIELLTNTLPWLEGGNDLEILHKKNNGMLDNFDNACASFSSEFRDALHKALQAQPEDRTSSMYDFFEELSPKQKMVRNKTNKTIIFKAPFNFSKTDEVKKESTETGSTSADGKEKETTNPFISASIDMGQMKERINSIDIKGALLKLKEDLNNKKNIDFSEVLSNAIPKMEKITLSDYVPKVFRQFPADKYKLAVGGLGILFLLCTFSQVHSLVIFSAIAFYALVGLLFQPYLKISRVYDEVYDKSFCLIHYISSILLLLVAGTALISVNLDMVDATFRQRESLFTDTLSIVAFMILCVAFALMYVFKIGGFLVQLSQSAPLQEKDLQLEMNPTQLGTLNFIYLKQKADEILNVIQEDEEDHRLTFNDEFDEKQNKLSKYSYHIFEGIVIFGFILFLF